MSTMLALVECPQSHPSCLGGLLPSPYFAPLRVQDLDSGHHGSGFPLPPFRQALLERHLAAQEAAGLLRKASRKKKRGAEAEEPEDSDGACSKAPTSARV